MIFRALKQPKWWLSFFMPCRHRILWTFLLYHQRRGEGPDTQGSLPVRQPTAHSCIFNNGNISRSDLIMREKKKFCGKGLMEWILNVTSRRKRPSVDNKTIILWGLVAFSVLQGWCSNIESPIKLERRADVRLQLGSWAAGRPLTITSSTTCVCAYVRVC